MSSLILSSQYGILMYARLSKKAHRIFAIATVMVRQEKTILFLEDEQQLLSTVGNLLLEQGYNVVRDRKSVV